MTMRMPVTIFALWVLLFSTACAGQPSSQTETSRVIILGFDGVEPSIVDAMIASGELPHLAQLSKQGTYARLGSSNPPQSPTAWSSFTTCKTPGSHGVYDFLRRDPKTYSPDVGFGATKQPELAPDGSLTRPASFQSYRKGESFWATADRQGLRCKVLTVPFAYPADDLTDSCMLCGLGVPDIRGTQSTFFWMSDAFTPEEMNEEVAGGIRLPLAFRDDVAVVELPGVRDPRVKNPTAWDAFARVPLTVSVDRKARTVTLSVQGQNLSVAEGNETPWIEWSFSVTPQYTVRAISRAHVLEAGNAVRLYMTCLMFHPRAPMIRMSTPPAYAGELADRHGLYKTIGWASDTHALRVGALDEDSFIADAAATMEWRRKITLDEMDRGAFRLLISVWAEPDRIAHMFWRFRDSKHPLYTEDGAKKYGRAVENFYARMDAIVGDVMSRLAPGDLLMILSDHGFHSFRMGFNVNTWLVRQGYLAVEGSSDAATAHNKKEFLQGYDWSRTQAYSIGLGSIFLNQQGRERNGIVPPDQANAVISEIRDKLLAVTDPATGEKIFNAVYTRDAYKGTELADAPDIELGYAEGYQSTKDAAKGAAPPELFEPNTSKWSGEHAASDVTISHGIFFANRSIAVQNPSLIDLGVTALRYLGALVPADFEGRNLLGE